MAGMTCNDWTSAGADVAAQVGHSDGFGPNQDTSGSLASWNSAHANLNCSNTAPRGGAGRLYCFARNCGDLEPYRRSGVRRPFLKPNALLIS